MAKFALIRGGAIVKYREHESADHLAHKIDKPEDGGDGGPFIRPVIDPGEPEYNRVIERVTRTVTLEKDAVRVTYEVTPLKLDDVKDDLLLRVDAAAERERALYLSCRPSKFVEYHMVAIEAAAYDANPDGFYPMLQASVDSGEVASLAEAAALVKKEATASAEVWGDIRKRRLKAKADIRAATGVHEAFDAFSRVVFQQSSLR